MISLEKLREVEPALKTVSDQELERIRDILYAHAEMALESFIEAKTGSNVSPVVSGQAENSMKKSSLWKKEEYKKE